jgi:hypothetical protein
MLSHFTDKLNRLLDDHIDGVKLRLWTAAVDGAIVHPPGNIQVWRTMVEWYRQKETPDSSTRALWQSYQQSHLLAKHKELAKEITNLVLRIIFVHTSKVSLTCLRGDSFTCSLKESVLRNSIVLKSPEPSDGIGPTNLGSNGKHASYYTTEDD